MPSPRKRKVKKNIRRVLDDTSLTTLTAATSLTASLEEALFWQGVNKSGSISASFISAELALVSDSDSDSGSYGLWSTGGAGEYASGESSDLMNLDSAAGEGLAYHFHMGKLGEEDFEVTAASGQASHQPTVGIIYGHEGPRGAYIPYYQRDGDNPHGTASIRLPAEITGSATGNTHIVFYVAGDLNDNDDGNIGDRISFFTGSALGNIATSATDANLGVASKSAGEITRGVAIFSGSDSFASASYYFPYGTLSAGIRIEYSASTSIRDDKLYAGYMIVWTASQASKAIT